MKLTLKLISFTFAVIIVLLAIDGYASVHREIALFDMDMQRDALWVGHAMKKMVLTSWKHSGPNQTIQFIKQANKPDNPIRIRWVWLDAESDNPLKPHVSLKKLQPVFEGRDVSIKTSGPENAGYRYTYVPMAVDPTRHGALELSEPLKELNDYTRNTVERSFILGGSMLLLGGFMLLVLGTKFIGHPLHQLVEKTRRVGGGDFSEDLIFRSKDELSTLAQAMNEMCLQLAVSRDVVRAETEARIAALEQLRHTERLSVLGRLASGMAHELGTPLNIISGRAQLIGTDAYEKAKIEESSLIIMEQTQRITKIVRQFLDFARRRAPHKTPVDLTAITQKALELLEATAAKQSVSLELLNGEDLPVITIDPFQMQQVLMNLFMNGIQAMPGGGTLKVSLRLEHGYALFQESNPDKTYIVLDVMDEGGGIAEAHMNHIFEPFFTTKEMGQGTGLGLSIAQGIVQEHDGWIDVKNRVEKGACFTVCLPIEAIDTLDKEV